MEQDTAALLAVCEVHFSCLSSLLEILTYLSISLALPASGR